MRTIPIFRNIGIVWFLVYINKKNLSSQPRHTLSYSLYTFVKKDRFMESITKKQILESIGKVYEQSKNCKLENSFFESIKSELDILSQYFKTSDNQTFFIAMVFALNYKGDTVDLNDLIEYFDCNPMKILEYSDDFEYLHKVGIFEKKKCYSYRE